MATGGSLDPWLGCLCVAWSVGRSSPAQHQQPYEGFTLLPKYLSVHSASCSAIVIDMFHIPLGWMSRQYISPPREHSATNLISGMVLYHGRSQGLTGHTTVFQMNGSTWPSDKDRASISALLCNSANIARLPLSLLPSEASSRVSLRPFLLLVTMG